MEIKIVLNVMLLVIVLEQTQAFATSVLDYNKFCVNNSLTFNLSCSVYSTEQSVIEDIFEAIENKKSLVVTHLSINSHTGKLTALEDDDIVLPLRWLIATTKLGRKFLMIKLHFESLSLTTLSFNVKHADISLIESPDGCLSNNSIRKYETLMRKFYFCGFNSSFGKDYKNQFGDHVFVCSLHRKKREQRYEENFRYVCCNKQNEQIICKEIEDDFIVFVFKNIYRIVLMIITALLCPHIIVVYIEIIAHEKIKAKSINASNQPLVQIQSRTFIAEPGILISSIKDVYSVRGFFIMCFNYTVEMFVCCSSCLKCRRGIVKGVVVILFQIFILCISSVGVSFHYIENLYYLDYRLYVIMYAVFISFAIYCVFCLTSLCLHCFTTEVDSKIVPDNIRSEYASICDDLQGRKCCKKIACFCTMAYFITRIPLCKMLCIMVKHIISTQRNIKIRCSLEMAVLVIDASTSFCLLVSYIFYFLFVFGQIFDIILFTVTGIAVNTEVVAQYLLIPLFVLFYAQQCFSEVYLEFKDYFDVIVKHLYQICLNHDYNYRKSDPNDLENQSEHQLCDKCFIFSTKGPVIFFDGIGKPRISKRFFLKACEMNCYGCPGSPLKNFCSAFLMFILWLLCFLFVLILIYTFEAHYKVSDWTQFLATFAGGILPWIFKFIVTRTKRKLEYLYDLKLSPFKKQFDALLKCYEENQIEIDSLKNDGTTTDTNNEHNEVDDKESKQPTNISQVVICTHATTDEHTEAGEEALDQTTNTS